MSSFHVYPVDQFTPGSYGSVVEIDRALENLFQQGLWPIMIYCSADSRLAIEKACLQSMNAVAHIVYGNESVLPGGAIVTGYKPKLTPYTVPLEVVGGPQQAVGFSIEAAPHEEIKSETKRPVRAIQVQDA